MKNVAGVLIGEGILFVAVCLCILLLGGGGVTSIALLIDVPSLLFVLLTLVPGLIIMGDGKDFIRAFSVGSSRYSPEQLSNIIGAVEAAQRLTAYGAVIAVVVSGVLVLKDLNDLAVLGPRLAVCFLSPLYAAFIELLLLPLKRNAQRRMNMIMDKHELHH